MWGLDLEFHPEEHGGPQFQWSSAPEGACCLSLLPGEPKTGPPGNWDPAELRAALLLHTWTCRDLRPASSFIHPFTRTPPIARQALFSALGTQRGAEQTPVWSSHVPGSTPEGPCRSHPMVQSGPWFPTKAPVAPDFPGPGGPTLVLGLPRLMSARSVPAGETGC